MENIPLKGTVVPNSFDSINNNSSSSGSSNSASAHDNEDAVFVCNVCLDSVRNSDPVVTQCGHLYCWPCLFRWLNTNHTTCPVCKAGVTLDNVIPIFIRGDGPTEDPRMKTAAAGGSVSSATNEEGGAIPSRPLGHRPEPVTMEPASPAINIGYNFAGLSFSAGFGFFPSLFGLQFQSFAPAPSGSAAESDDEMQQAYLSRVLLFLGLSVIFCLLFF